MAAAGSGREAFTPSSKVEKELRGSSALNFRRIKDGFSRVLRLETYCCMVRSQSSSLNCLALVDVQRWKGGKFDASLAVLMLLGNSSEFIAKAFFPEFHLRCFHDFMKLPAFIVKRCFSYLKKA